ncbi:MAG: nitronate monooxygenase [Candidatus Sabulitectum sp.]|nr:nitronate monooxygenase [Candidatus Sabulitectum sp.]
MKIPSLKIGDLTIRIPIIQGGMGVSVSKASLASAVSLAGGLGVIASVGLGEEMDTSIPYLQRSRQALASEIRQVRQQGLPVGVNVMVALTNFGDLVKTSAEEGVDVLFAGAGLPLRLPEFAGDSPMKLVPIISSGRAADVICRSWRKKYSRFPDAIVVEGPMAGGHLGFKLQDLLDGTASDLDTLVRETLIVVERCQQEAGRKIPVIAAGGVYTGADLAKFLNMGASGVQMGTRFVATHECDVSDEYKQSYVDATEDDVAVILSPVGLPARVIKNPFVEKCLGEKQEFKCFYKCLITCGADKANYCIALALLDSSRGHMDTGFPMCGENVHRIKKIVSVQELIQELTTEAEPLLS